MSKNKLKKLTRFIYKIAKHKLGFPTSLLSTNRNFINNEILGIKPNSLANILLNNVGDPFKTSDSWSLEVKDFEVEILQVIARLLGLEPEQARGYITSGSTEANEAAFRWSKKYLLNKSENILKQATVSKENILLEIKKIEQQNKEFLTDNNEKFVDNDSVKIIENSHHANDVLENSIRINLLYKSLLEQLKIINDINKPTLICTKKYTHYSNYKIAESKDLSILEIEANADGNMDVLDLKSKLSKHIENNPNNTLIVNCNMGTTITGAVDDIVSIKQILDDFPTSINYTIHMDGAMYGMLLPILQPLGYIENYFKYANTLSISFHKYLGLPQPCGMCLTKKSFLDFTYKINDRIIEYAGNIIDTTVSGSRSGFNVLLIYHTIFNALNMHINNDRLIDLVQKDLAKAENFYKKLVLNLGKDKVFWVRNQFNILIKKPSHTLVKKYQLMVFNDYVVICVLANVTNRLINDFIQDVVLENNNKESNYVSGQCKR